MKKLKGFAILLILLGLSNKMFAQDTDYQRISHIKDEIFLDKYPKHYLITYEDYSMDSKGQVRSFKIEHKKNLTELYQTIKNSFSNQEENPTSLNFKEVELRIYFKKRLLRADYVEIIQEDLNSESTATLPWLTLEEAEKLLNIKK